MKIKHTRPFIPLKKIQLDTLFIFSICRQKPVNISGVSIAHHQEVHRKDITIDNYCSF